MVGPTSGVVILIAIIRDSIRCRSYLGRRCHSRNSSRFDGRSRNGCSPVNWGECRRHIPESIPRPIDAFLEATVADTCLEISMNWTGPVRIESPTFPIDPRNAYRNTRCSGWRKSSILTWRKPLSTGWTKTGAQIGEQLMSPSVQKTTPWQIGSHQRNLGSTDRHPIRQDPHRRHSLSSRSIQTIVRCDRVRVELIPRIELA